MHTRLSFNDSGRITHHQDIWDVKDVFALIPGVGIAQWIGSRVLAHSLANASDLCEWMSKVRRDKDGRSAEGGDETPRGLYAHRSTGAMESQTHSMMGSDTPGIDIEGLSSLGGVGVGVGASSSSSAANALGLQLSDQLSNLKSRAPDTDTDRDM